MTTAVDRYWTGHTVRAERFRAARVRAQPRVAVRRVPAVPRVQRPVGRPRRRDRPRLRLRSGERPDGLRDPHRRAAHDRPRRLADRARPRRRAARAARRRPTACELLQGGATTTRRSRSTDDSVDHVNCQGVLHHTSHPEAILAELARVLRPGGTATIMVYNRDSVWLHLYTAYERMIVEGAFAGLDVEEAFARNTDGPDCPISRCYAAEDFLGMCRRRGARRRLRRRLPVPPRAPGARDLVGRGRSPTGGSPPSTATSCASSRSTSTRSRCTAAGTPASAARIRLHRP